MQLMDIGVMAVIWVFSAFFNAWLSMGFFIQPRSTMIGKYPARRVGSWVGLLTPLGPITLITIAIICGVVGFKHLLSIALGKEN